MKALTICEPWAWAIVDLAHMTPEWKRIENRADVFPKFAGPLLIHSGKTPRYVPTWKECRHKIFRVAGVYPPAFAELAGRGLIGVADVAATVRMETLRENPKQVHAWAHTLGLDYLRMLNWIEGPICLCLRSVARFETPIAWRGQQGLFEVPDDVVRDAIEAAQERAGIRDFGGG